MKDDVTSNEPETDPPGRLGLDVELIADLDLDAAALGRVGGQSKPTVTINSLSSSGGY